MSSDKNDPVIYATLAQMDRAPGYELGGQEFDSLRSRHALLV